MSEAPCRCPECKRSFAWGRDADSAAVEAKGERWISCAENAHWKLVFHMRDAHPGVGFVCERRAESWSSMQGKDAFDFWKERDGYKCCSYCGSMSPAELFQAIETGLELTPTDKNYKVYVEWLDSREGQLVEIGSESGPAFDPVTGERSRSDLTDGEIRLGRYQRPIMRRAGRTITAKFYFQHLSPDEQQRFVDLLNAKKIKLAYPGYFYRPPFFCAPVKKDAAAAK